MSLQKRLNHFFDVIIVSYPGRGKRLSEPFANNFGALVQDCIGQLKSYIDKQDFYILGHSFGALVAFECLRVLDVANEKMPVKAFLSGRGAPSEPIMHPLKHLMTDIELIDYLNSIGGIPSELSGNTDFLSFFLPIIRNDLKLNELYEYKNGKAFDIPLVILNGEDDKGVKQEAIDSWQKETQIPLKKVSMEGGHFFIMNNSHLM